MSGNAPAECRKMAAVGMFDGVHRGHRSLIAELALQAAGRGLEPLAFTFTDHPMAAIAPDRCPPMLSTVDERRRLLIEAGAADVVALDFSAVRHLTAQEFMAMLHIRYGVDTLLMGFNNHIGSDRLRGMDAYQQAGRAAGVEVLTGTEYTGEGAPCSSSIVRSDIMAGRIGSAALRLGRNYAIEGTVVPGKQLGRIIGFPTANLRSNGTLLPATGVYAADTDVDGTVYRTIVNIGRRPTVDADGAPITVEAHLIGYSGDLYGRALRLELLRRLRDERRFASVDELALQLRADADAALRL